MEIGEKFAGMAEQTLPAAHPESGVPVDLRPLTTSELIDRGFALYRAHFAGLLLISLLAQSGPLVAQILITSFRLQPEGDQLRDDPWGSFYRLAVFFIVVLAARAASFCFNAVATGYIAEAYLGKIPSVTASLRRFAGRPGPALWTFLLAWFLIVLTLILPVGVLATAYLALLHYHPVDFTVLIAIGVGTLILLVLSLVPVLIVFMRLWVTVPPLMLEDRSGWKAVRRSVGLVRFDPGLGFLYWGEMRLSFLLLPPFVISLLILFLPSLPYLASEAFRHGHNPPPEIAMVCQILNFLAGSLIWPLYAIATTLFYYDVRIRLEGFDLEFMTRRLETAK